MKEYLIYPYKSNLYFNKNKVSLDKNSIQIINNKNNNYTYKTIYYPNLDDKEKIINSIKKVLKYFFKKLNINNTSHILIVGLGNKNHTADSIGPSVLKYIKVNSFYENFHIQTNGIKVSTLAPGVFGQTGILTDKIIKSVVKEIKPDLVILIDSFISDNIDYLNKTIQISNEGITEGLSFKGLFSKIDADTLKVPIITIGVNTAIEIKFSKDTANFIPYILSTKNIDDYVLEISQIIAYSINKLIF